MQQTVGQNHHIIKIAEEIGDAVVDRGGENRLVGPGDRFDDRFIGGFVEREHRTIEALEGIGIIAQEFVGRGAPTQQGGNDGH